LASQIALANEIVPFATACRLAGYDVPPARESGTKTFCMFGELAHPDGGREPALRVYPDHGWCFAESLYLSPSRIYALANDLDEHEAAVQLLDLTGYRPASWQKHWDDLVAERVLPDTNALAEALRIHLSASYPDWQERQYDPAAAGMLARCLGLLPLVRTSGDCSTWLERAKIVMARALGGTR